MGTSASAIFDRFMMLVSDYRLTTLYQDDVTNHTNNFNTYLEGWLIQAIDDFSICTQSLAYSTTSQQFTATLTEEHQNILARIMVRYWMEKEVNDITQMSLHITDKDFHTYSESQNLTAKQQLLAQKREEIDLLLSRYGYKNVDWTNWWLQDFDGV